MSGWVIFAALNLIQFQPHLWDNTKLLTWAHVLLVVPVWFSLDGVWRWRKWIGKVVAIILFVVLTLSSWFDVWRLTRVDRNAYPMWSYVDLQRAATVNALTQPGERVLAAQNHNHWVVAHTHLQTLMGFPGWLWTYGVTDPQLAGDITTMFQGGAAAESLLDFYDVKYVVIGNPERNDLKANQAWFEDHHDILLQDEEYTVYQTSSEYWSEPSAPAEE